MKDTKYSPVRKNLRFSLIVSCSRSFSIKYPVFVTLFAYLYIEIIIIMIIKYRYCEL